jgi:PAS domain S-box-containing protein
MGPLEKIESELQEERDRLSATIDSLMDPHVMLLAIRDPLGKIVDFEYTQANEAACKYNQMAREDLIGRRLLDLFPGHATTGLLERFVNTIETGEPIVLDDYAYDNDILHASRRYDVRGVKLGDQLSYTWCDVTDWYGSLELYRLVAENASDIVYRATTDGIIEWVSPSIFDATGWHPDDLVGRSIGDIVRQEDYQTRPQLIETSDRTGSVRTDGQVLCADGSFRWFSLVFRSITNDDGTVIARVGSARNIEETMAAREALETSEKRYRILAENASDIVYETDVNSVIEWISPSVERLLGMAPKGLVGRHSYELIDPEDRERVGALREQLNGGDSLPPCDIRYVNSEGEMHWFKVNAHPIFDEDGTVIGSVVSMSDSQREVVTRRALNTLSAGNEILVRVKSEHELLLKMCQTAVDEGGYLFSWYARPVDDENFSVEVVAASEDNHEYLDGIEITWSDLATGQGPVGRSIRLNEVVITDDFIADPATAPWHERASQLGFRSSIALPVFVKNQFDGSLMVYASETGAFDTRTVGLLKDLSSQLGYGLEHLREQEALIQAVNDQRLLGTAIDQATESVIVTDTSASILYANPSALRTSGYSLEEVIGQNPRLFNSGLGERAIYDDLWSHLSEGKSWHGILSNRRKNGDLYDEDASISPIFETDGTLMAYVAVKRDLTVERQLETNLLRQQRDRSDLNVVMRDVRPRESLEDTAVAFCEAVVGLDSIDSAFILLAQDDGDLLPIGVAGATDASLSDGTPFRPTHPGLAVKQTDDGPWWQDLRDRDGLLEHEKIDQAREDGYSALAWSAIRSDEKVTGLLGIGIKDPGVGDWIDSRLPTFEELGAFAGTLFGAQASQFGELASLRAQIRRVIDEEQFHPVFQPVVDLATSEVVGYEALTRFDDVRRPDLRFVEAATVGLGIELELACGRAALREARKIPSERWLSLNFSPAAVVDGQVAELKSESLREFGIEITEHAQIDDYTALLRAIGQIEGCQLLVDDAGAGYASLCHILELHPNFIKLDISLVRDLDSDPARQALVSGMRHFATETKTILLAEGVESQGEADALKKLGVDLAQGYLFGKPGPLPDAF